MKILFWFEIAKVHGKTAAQVALRFLMQSGVVVIPKSVHADRIKENFNLFDFELTADEMNQLVKMDTAMPIDWESRRSCDGRGGYEMVEGQKTMKKKFYCWGATGTAGSAITKKLLADTDCHITKKFGTVSKDNLYYEWITGNQSSGSSANVVDTLITKWVGKQRSSMG